MIINLDVTYQYKALPFYLRDIIMAFKDFDGYEAVLTQVGMLFDQFICTICDDPSTY